MEPTSRHQIGRLKLQVGKNAIDDFESQCEPLHAVEYRGGIRASRERLFNFEHNFGFDSWCDHPFQRKDRSVCRKLMNGVVVHMSPDQGFESERLPLSFVREPNLPANGGLSRGFS